MKRVYRETLKIGSALLFGTICAFALVRATQGPGTLIVKQEEALGNQFSDPALLDVFVKLDQREVCPRMTQRYVWRWITYQGKRVQQAVPVESTLMPFFPENNTMILTLPNPGVPDINDKWYYRTVSVEQCGIMPTSALNALLGTSVYKSPDQRVTFIGANTKSVD